MVSINGISELASNLSEVKDTFHSVMDASIAFEKSLNSLKVATKVNSSQLRDLKDEAFELGRSTAYSSTEVVDAMGAIADAGFRVDEIFNVTNESIKLATIGNLDLAKSGDILSSAIAGYGLSASDSNRVIDVLSANASASGTNIEALSEALNLASISAKSANVSFEEASAIATTLENAGEEAKTAGKAMDSLFTTLHSPPRETLNMLKELHIDPKTLKNFSSISEVFGEIVKHTQGFSEDKQLNIANKLFGEGAGDEALILMKEYDKTFKDFLVSANEADGLDVANKAYSELSDTLDNSLKKMQNSLENLKIEATTPFLEPLKEQIDEATILINNFTKSVDFKAIGEESANLVGYAKELVIAYGAFKASGFIVKGFGVLRNSVATLRETMLLLNTAVRANPLLFVMSGAIYAGIKIFENWDTILEKITGRLGDIAKLTQNELKSKISSITEEIKKLEDEKSNKKDNSFFTWDSLDEGKLRRLKQQLTEVKSQFGNNIDFTGSYSLGLEGLNKKVIDFYNNFEKGLILPSKYQEEIKKANQEYEKLVNQDFNKLLQKDYQSLDKVYNDVLSVSNSTLDDEQKTKYYKFFQEKAEILTKDKNNTSKHIDLIGSEWNKYYLNQYEQLDSWYTKQKEEITSTIKDKENQKEQLLKLDELYKSKKDKLYQDDVEIAQRKFQSQLDFYQQYFKDLGDMDSTWNIEREKLRNEAIKNSLDTTSEEYEKWITIQKSAFFESKTNTEKYVDDINKELSLISKSQKRENELSSLSFQKEKLTNPFANESEFNYLQNIKSIDDEIAQIQQEAILFAEKNKEITYEQAKSWQDNIDFLNDKKKLTKDIYESENNELLQLRNKMVNSFQAGFTEILTGAKSFEEGFKDIFVGIGKDVLDTFANNLAKSVTTLIYKSISSYAGVALNYISGSSGSGVSGGTNYLSTGSSLYTAGKTAYSYLGGSSAGSSTAGTMSAYTTAGSTNSTLSVGAVEGTSAGSTTAGTTSVYTGLGYVGAFLLAGYALDRLAFSNIKMFEKGLNVTEKIIGFLDTEIESVQSYIGFKEKSMFKTHKWNEFGDLTKKELFQVQTFLGGLQSTLNNFTNTPLEIMPDKYTSKQFKETAIKSFISAMIGDGKSFLDYKEQDLYNDSIKKATVSKIGKSYQEMFKEMGITAYYEADEATTKTISEQRDAYIDHIYKVWSDYAKEAGTTVEEAVIQIYSQATLTDRNIKTFGLKGVDLQEANLDYQKSDLQDTLKTYFPELNLDEMLKWDNKKFSEWFNNQLDEAADSPEQTTALMSITNGTLNYKNANEELNSSILATIPNMNSLTESILKASNQNLSNKELANLTDEKTLDTRDLIDYRQDLVSSEKTQAEVTNELIAKYGYSISSATALTSTIATMSDTAFMSQIPLSDLGYYFDVVAESAGLSKEAIKDLDSYILDLAKSGATSAEIIVKTKNKLVNDYGLDKKDATTLATLEANRPNLDNTTTSTTTDITPMQDTSIPLGYNPLTENPPSADSFSQSYDFSSTIEKLDPKFKTLGDATKHLDLNLETINKGSIKDYIATLEELEKATATTKEEYDNNQLAVAKINAALDEFGSGLKSVSKTFLEIVGDNYGISAFTSEKDKELIANRELFFGYGIDTSNTKDFKTSTQSFIDENFVKGALEDGVITLDEVKTTSKLTQENIDELNRFLPITTARLKEEDQAHQDYIKTYEDNKNTFLQSLDPDKTFFGEWSKNTSDIKADGANLGLEGIGELITGKLNDIFDDTATEVNDKLKLFGKDLEDFSSVDEARTWLETQFTTYGNIMIEGAKAQEESTKAQEEYTKSLKKSADTLFLNSLNFAHGLNRDNVFYGNLAFSKKDIQSFGATKSIDTIQEQSVDESKKIWKAIRNDDYDSLANILLKNGVKQTQIDAQYKKEDGSYDVNQMGQDILGQQEQFWNLQAEGYYQVEDFKKSFENFGDNFLTESEKVDNALKFFNFDKASLNIEDFTSVVNGSVDGIDTQELRDRGIDIEDYTKYFQENSQVLVSYLNNLKSSLTSFNKSIEQEITNLEGTYEIAVASNNSDYTLADKQMSEITDKMLEDTVKYLDTLNPEEFITEAEKVKKLVVDRYNYEKQQLQEQKSLVLSFRDSYNSLGSKLREVNNIHYGLEDVKGQINTIKNTSDDYLVGEVNTFNSMLSDYFSTQNELSNNLSSSIDDLRGYVRDLRTGSLSYFTSSQKAEIAKTDYLSSAKLLKEAISSGNSSDITKYLNETKTFSTNYLTALKESGNFRGYKLEFDKVVAQMGALTNQVSSSSDYKTSEQLQVEQSGYIQQVMEELKKRDPLVLEPLKSIDNHFKTQEELIQKNAIATLGTLKASGESTLGSIETSTDNLSTLAKGGLVQSDIETTAKATSGGKDSIQESNKDIRANTSNILTDDTNGLKAIKEWLGYINSNAVASATALGVLPSIGIQGTNQAIATNTLALNNPTYGLEAIKGILEIIRDNTANPTIVYQDRIVQTTTYAPTPTLMMSEGGVIDGIAPFVGDDERNDIVPAMYKRNPILLSAGEAIIPRTSVEANRGLIDTLINNRGAKIDRFANGTILSPSIPKSNSNSNDLAKKLDELIRENKEIKKELQEIKNYSSRSSFFIQKIFKIARDWVNGLFSSNTTSTQGSSVTKVLFEPTYNSEIKTDNVTIVGNKIYLSSLPQGDVLYVLIHFDNGTSEVARDYILSDSEITLSTSNFNGLSAEVKYLVRKEVA